jgi:uncharacterized protein (DUF1501 family)
MNNLPNETTSRRSFIAGSCCAAVGATGLLSALGSMRLMAAAASPSTRQPSFSQESVPGDYKALVCLFLNGGNDANNLIIPTGLGYKDYSLARSNLAIPESSLLSISPRNSDGRTWGLHPSVPELNDLFVKGKLAFLANVGTLVYPTTKAQYIAGSIPLPPQLYSHSDQQVQWQHSVPDKPTSTGWGGRVADLVNSLNTSNQISMSISLAGKNTFQIGTDVSEYAIGTSGAVSLTGSTSSSTSLDGIRFKAQKDLISQSQAGLLESAFGSASSDAIVSADLLNGVLAKSPTVTTVFPSTSVGSQLKMAARLIAAAPAIGLKRQVFFVQLGGWDTHASQLDTSNPTSGTHASLLQQISQGVNAFYNATIELGVANQVTTFTASDFGRTFRSNGDGSDHGWGNHQFILGGAVNGSTIYGKMPTLSMGGPDDTGQGRWIPTTSVDEYAATLASWFGVSSSNLPIVLPNIGRFANPNLGFLG